MRILGVARVAVGPPALMAIGALEGLRPRGPLTVSLTHPAPPWTLVVADVLVVLVIVTIALWAAAGLAGRKRPLLLHYTIPAAASQLPLAGVALVLGRRILAGPVTKVVAEQGEELLKDPTPVLSALTHPIVGTVLLTGLAAVWLYQGYRRVSGLEGWRLVVSLLGAILAAEVACRVWFGLLG